MTYFSGFTTSHHATLTWREFTAILKKRDLAVLKWHKNHKFWVFISSQYELNTCIYTFVLIKTSQKSTTRVGYITFHNNEFAALWDHYKVFRLSKNNLVSLTTENGIFASFLYGRQTFLVPKRSFRLEQRFLKILKLS